MDSPSPKSEIGIGPPPLAFTLVELMVVIGIIVLLIGILLPVLNKVRQQGNITATRAQIVGLEQAAESYHQDYGAYPGVYSEATLASSPAYDRVSGTENLVFSLMGGHADTNGSDYRDAAALETNGLLHGPEVSIAAVLENRRAAYYVPKQNELRKATDDMEVSNNGGSGAEDDIPEFFDRFSDGRPLLYLRAQPGRSYIIGDDSSDIGSAIFNAAAAYAYTKALSGLSQSYLGHAGNIAKLVSDPRYTESDPGLYDPAIMSANSVQNFCNNNPWKVHQADRFVLISAGPDHIYGTADDICNFDLQPKNHSEMAPP